MITLSELTTYLNRLLTPELFKDYCPNGLQLEGKDRINKIGFAVSADMYTLEKAVEYKINALICHHGLFWNKDPLSIIGSKKKKVELLLHHQISLYGYHLPLDAHKEVGNNWVAAKALGLRDLLPFGEFNGLLIGVKGHFNAMPTKHFIEKLEKYYGHTAMVALGGKENVASAAIISGGAWGSFLQAKNAEADCFITGSFDEPVWGWAYEEKIHFMALGHTATERVGPKALSEKISRELNIETLFIESANPF